MPPDYIDSNWLHITSTQWSIVIGKNSWISIVVHLYDRYHQPTRHMFPFYLHMVVIQASCAVTYIYLGATIEEEVSSPLQIQIHIDNHHMMKCYPWLTQHHSTNIFQQQLAGAHASSKLLIPRTKNFFPKLAASAVNQAVKTHGPLVFYMSWSFLPPLTSF